MDAVAIGKAARLRRGITAEDTVKLGNIVDAYWDSERPLYLRCNGIRVALKKHCKDGIWPKPEDPCSGIMQDLQ